MRPKPRHLLDHREFPVLYVDDEPENLRVFELAFRRDFKILTAASAEEGLRILNENPVAVVLSDQRMPGVTGVEFLARVRDLDAKTVRILVTAYGDVEILGQAINDGSIYRYVPKPWDPVDMRLTLRRAIESYALEQERQVLLGELTLINRLSHSLHSEMDLNRLFHLLLSAVQVEVGFDGAAILFFDSDGQNLIWKNMMPGEAALAEGIFSIALNTDTAPDLLGRLRKGESPLLRLEDSESLESGVRKWVTEVSAEEILVVPLVGKDEVIGALAVDNRSGGRCFGIDDQTLLEGLATQAVIAMENARLVEELRSSREQVMRVDRLGTLGTLAAGIAHEINNPLVSIHTFLSLAPEKRLEKDESFWGDYHRLASAELERIKSLVSSMSQLARGRGGESTERSLVDLGEVAGEVVGLMERETEQKGILLDLKVDPEARPVLGVRAHLHQVLLNLVINAVQAVGSAGRVEVHVEPDPERPRERTHVRVEDSGHGIAEENIEKIFDPFFTTKDPDQGTGLGLMIAHEITTEHGGDIEVSSRDQQGSTFLIRLPTAGPSAASPSPS